jgi:hypothetical protein
VAAAVEAVVVVVVLMLRHGIGLTLEEHFV